MAFDILQVREKLRIKHIVDNPSCPMWGAGEVFVYHVLVECYVAQ